MLMLGSAPVLNHVIISDNRVDNQTYGNGGGIYI